MLINFVTALVLLAAQAYCADISGSFHYELGLNSTAYQQKFDQLLENGYRPTYIDAYSDDQNQTLFSGVWEKPTTSVAWVARHGLTGAQYDSLSSQLQDQNYHPVVLNGYNLEDGETRFATIWEKASVGTWQQKRDLTQAQLKAAVASLSPLRLTTLSRYTVENEVRFAATWGKRTAEDWTGDWNYYLGQTPAQYQRLSAGQSSEAFKPISLHVHSVNGDPVFDSVWQRYGAPGASTPRTWYDTYSATAEVYKSNYNSVTGMGFGPRVLTGYYYEGCGIQYAGTFEERP